MVDAYEMHNKNLDHSLYFVPKVNLARTEIDRTESRPAGMIA